MGLSSDIISLLRLVTDIASLATNIGLSPLGSRVWRWLRSIVRARHPAGTLSYPGSILFYMNMNMVYSQPANNNPVHRHRSQRERGARTRTRGTLPARSRPTYEIEIEISRGHQSGHNCTQGSNSHQGCYRNTIANSMEVSIMRVGLGLSTSYGLSEGRKGKSIS